MTGSRGFIGGTLGRFFASRGHAVLGLGHASRSAASWPGDYVQSDVAHADFSFVIGDFRPDVVLHAAGTASVAASFSSPHDDLCASVLTWANTLENIRRSGTRPLIVFLSSAAVYGDPAGLPVAETAPIAPISPYGFHKAACELLACEHAECFGQSVLVCRLFSVFGPDQRRLLVWELYERLRSPGETVDLAGTGLESRDYLHIDDVGRAIVALVARWPIREEPGCAIVNVGRGEETPVARLAEELRDLLAPDKLIRWRGTRRPGDPLRWRADTTRLRALVPDWSPRPLSPSLEECVRTWERQQESLSIAS